MLSCRYRDDLCGQYGNSRCWGDCPHLECLRRPVGQSDTWLQIMKMKVRRIDAMSASITVRVAIYLFRILCKRFGSGVPCSHHFGVVFVVHPSRRRKVSNFQRGKGLSFRDKLVSLFVSKIWNQRFIQKRPKSSSCNWPGSLQRSQACSFLRRMFCYPAFYGKKRSSQPWATASSTAASTPVSQQPSGMRWVRRWTIQFWFFDVLCDWVPSFVPVQRTTRLRSSRVLRPMPGQSTQSDWEQQQQRHAGQRQHDEAGV